MPVGNGITILSHYRTTSVVLDSATITTYGET